MKKTTSKSYDFSVDSHFSEFPKAMDALIAQWTETHKLPKTALAVRLQLRANCFKDWRRGMSFTAKREFIQHVNLYGMEAGISENSIVALNAADPGRVDAIRIKNSLLAFQEGFAAAKARGLTFDADFSTLFFDLLCANGIPNVNKAEETLGLSDSTIISILDGKPPSSTILFKLLVAGNPLHIPNEYKATFIQAAGPEAAQYFHTLDAIVTRAIERKEPFAQTLDILRQAAIFRDEKDGSFRKGITREELVKVVLPTGTDKEQNKLKHSLVHFDAHKTGLNLDDAKRIIHYFVTDAYYPLSHASEKSIIAAYQTETQKKIIPDMVKNRSALGQAMYDFFRDANCPFPRNQFGDYLSDHIYELECGKIQSLSKRSLRQFVTKAEQLCAASEIKPSAKHVVDYHIASILEAADTNKEALFADTATILQTARKMQRSTGTPLGTLLTTLLESERYDNISAPVKNAAAIAQLKDDSITIKGIYKAVNGKAGVPTAKGWCILNAILEAGGYDTQFSNSLRDKLDTIIQLSAEIGENRQRKAATPIEDMLAKRDRIRKSDDRIFR